MSRWTVDELRGARRSLKAALTHLNRAIAATSAHRSELEGIRAGVHEHVARVRRALKHETEALTTQEGNHADR